MKERKKQLSVGKAFRQQDIRRPDAMRHLKEETTRLKIRCNLWHRCLIGFSEFLSHKIVNN